MPLRDGYAHGDPSWVDLATTDVDPARDFYSGLFGWDWVAGETPDGSPYWMATIDGRLVIGLAALPPDRVDQGAPSAWNTYINVDDVAQATEAATAAGAHVLAGPVQIGDSGSMSFVLDPSGAAIGMWQPGTHRGAQIVNEHGAVTWNEVYAPDTIATIEFYGTVFGWTTSEMKTPDGGNYTMFVNGEGPIGGTVQPPSAEVPPHWHVWFASNDVATTVDRANALGATTLLGPMATPMGAIASFRDPQGAVFSVITAPSDD